MNSQRSIVLGTLDAKFRYLLTTCPQTLEHIPVLGEAAEEQLKCKFCAAFTAGICKTCLECTVSTALSRYMNAEKNMDDLKGLDKDPRIDLAFVASSVLVKLSGLHQTSTSRLPPLSNVDVARLMQAVVILGAQVSKTPNEVPLRLLLVQFYLLLGCASLAYQTWLPMDVKRTIQDALSPQFFDRIASVSPGLFSQGKHLTEPLTSYYGGLLRQASPVKVWDAFAAGSYSSILDMANYWDRLRRSCTIVMTAVEERRATRALGGRLDVDIEQLPLLCKFLLVRVSVRISPLTSTIATAHIGEDTEFESAIDYGSFPSLESSYAPPLYKLVKLGPELSVSHDEPSANEEHPHLAKTLTVRIFQTERCRLAILSERFLETVNYKAPKDYKPTKASEVATKERAYLTETYTRLQESFSTLLFHPSSTTAAKLTAAEHKYYNLLNFLAALLRTALETSRSAPSPPTLSTTVTGITSTLASLRANFFSVPPQKLAPQGDVFHALANPHLLSTLRDAALATKQAASFLVAFNTAENARDRTGKSNLHKEIVAEAKTLESLAGKTLAEVKTRLAELKAVLGQGGWLDIIAAWTFDEEDELGELVREVVGEAELEEWSGRVVESWREGVKGLEQVRME